MAKKVAAPRVEVYKTKKGEFNYRLIGRNGRLLMQNTQGYKRKAGLDKNLAAVSKFFAGAFAKVEVAK